MSQNDHTPQTDEPLNDPQELRPPDAVDYPMRERLRTADETVRNFVKEKPLASVAIALGAGFLLGKIITRRRGD